MRFSHRSILTGALLSAIVSVIAAPVFANPVVEKIGAEEISQQVFTAYSGNIKNVVGDIVTIQLDNGQIKTLRIPLETIKIKSLAAGKRIVAVVKDNSVIVDSVNVIPQTTTSTTSTTSTIPTTSTTSTTSTTPTTSTTSTTSTDNCD